MAQSGSLTFLSASQVSSFSTQGNVDNRTWYATTGSSSAVDMHGTFVGLNNIIVDVITSSANTLGYPISSLNSSDVALAATGSTDTQYLNRKLIPSSSYSEGAMSAIAFNALMLHRNGPYQHPSWKQIRGGEHPVARKLRLNNTMSIDFSDPDPIKREHARKIHRKHLEEGTLAEVDKFFKSVNLAGAILGANSKLNKMPSPYPASELRQYYEPSVVKNHKPFIYDVSFFAPIFGAQTGKVRSTLMNQIIKNCWHCKVKWHHGCSWNNSSQAGLLWPRKSS